MATVVDALTVTLGLDPSGFKKGQAETQESLKKTEAAASRTAKTMQSDGGKMAEALSGAKAQALSLLGVFIGARGIESAIKNSVNSMISLSQQATNAGVATSSMQGFALAMERAGGNAQSARDALVQYKQAMTSFFQGGKNFEQIQELQILGIAPSMTPEQAMRRLMQDVERDKNNPTQWSNLYARATRAGVPGDVLNAMHQIGTVENYDKQIEASQKQWDANKKAEDAAFALRDATATLNQSVDKFETVVMKGLSPSLIRFEQWMTTIVDRWTKEYEGGTSERVDAASLGMGLPEDKDLSDLIGEKLGWGNPNRSARPSLMDPGQQERAASVRDRLASDLGLTKEQASGIVSNLHAESGIRGINEDNPIVPGSRGGFGWAQWTGPRRRAFEAWSQMHGLDPASDEANYGYLLYELRTPGMRGILNSVRTAPDATAAANAFFPFESGGDASLENTRGKHVVNAAQIAGFGRGGPRASNTTVTVGDVHVHTAATNPRAIASDISADLQTAIAGRGLR